MRSLEGVKTGDKIVCRANYGTGYDVFQVTKLTATQAVCGPKAFMLASAKMIGTVGLAARYGRLPTAEELAEIELRNRIAFAQHQLAKLALTAETIDAAEALIASVAAQKAGG